jgi:hypothetical protein
MSGTASGARVPSFLRDALVEAGGTASVGQPVEVV